MKLKALLTSAAIAAGSTFAIGGAAVGVQVATQTAAHADTTESFTYVSIAAGEDEPAPPGQLQYDPTDDWMETNYNYATRPMTDSGVTEDPEGYTQMSFNGIYDETTQRWSFQSDYNGNYVGYNANDVGFIDAYAGTDGADEQFDLVCIAGTSTFYMLNDVADDWINSWSGLTYPRGYLPGAGSTSDAWIFEGQRWNPRTLSWESFCTA